METATRGDGLVRGGRETGALPRARLRPLLAGPPPVEAPPREREGLAGGLRGVEERTGPRGGRTRF
ncbi:MAG: hypothetical protein ACK6BG_11340 [Cyanobacteriota bacterium]